MWSSRVSRTLRCMAATRRRAMARFAEPFSLRTAPVVRGSDAVLLPAGTVGWRSPHRRRSSPGCSSPGRCLIAVASGKRGGRTVPPRTRPSTCRLARRITVTDDGTDGRSRDHSTRTSPTLATYSRCRCNANPLRVRRTDWRPCLRRGFGCLICRPFRRPASESYQFLYARRASWHAWTRATEATSPSHTRSGVSLARVITRRCTSVSEIFSPAAYASSRTRRQSL